MLLLFLTTLIIFPPAVLLFPLRLLICCRLEPDGVMLRAAIYFYGALPLRLCLDLNNKKLSVNKHGRFLHFRKKTKKTVQKKPNINYVGIIRKLSPTVAITVSSEKASPYARALVKGLSGFFGERLLLSIYNSNREFAGVKLHVTFSIMQIIMLLFANTKIRKRA